MRRRKGVNGVQAAAALALTILFFGLALRFGGSIGSIISGIFSLFGVVGDITIPFLNLSVLFIVELLVGIGLYIGGSYVIDTASGGMPTGFWRSMEITALVIGVALVVFAISGTLEGFGLRFSSYVGGEGLLFVGTIAILKDLFRFLLKGGHI